MVTLFRGISGSDWSLLAEPLLPIGWGAGAMWFLYLVVVFGLLTTFTGAVVDVLRRPLPIDVEVAMAEDRAATPRARQNPRIANKNGRQPTHVCPAG